MPLLLTPEATIAIDSLLEQLQAADDKQAVEIVRKRYVTLKQIIIEAHNPFNMALQALLQATSPAKLRQVVAQYPILLEDETLDRLPEIANEVEQAGDTIMAPRLRLRVSEVRHFKQPHDRLPRSVAPERQETVEYENTPGMRIESDRGSISGDKVYNPTINNIHIEGQSVPERRWQEPAQQVFDEKKPFVGRRDKLDEATKYLTLGEDVAIVGKTRALALQGLAGIGKTYMARKLGVDLYDHFGHRVFWLDFGNEEVNEQILLGKLAGCVFGGVVPAGQLDVEQVRSWLQETIPPPARFLVIFDDVWPQAPLDLLSRALPANAVRLITTRNRVVAQGISRKVIELDRLDLQDGLELLEDRLNDQDDATYHDAAYHQDLKELVGLLDGHALALEIAAAMIRQPVWMAEILSALREGIGQGRLDHLQVPEDRDLNLERSLALSYERMAPEQRSRFRALGVFAPETPITPEAAAAIWGLQGEHALRDASLFLRELADLAFLVNARNLPSQSIANIDCSRSMHMHSWNRNRNLLVLVGHMHNIIQN